jgi:hypothetical protein
MRPPARVFKRLADDSLTFEEERSRALQYTLTAYGTRVPLPWRFCGFRIYNLEPTVTVNFNYPLL